MAASRGTSTRIAAAIDDEVELNGAAFALGGGVDALLVPRNLVNDAVTILGGNWDIEKTQDGNAYFEEARILSIEGAGVGERVEMIVGTGGSIGGPSKAQAINW